MKRKIICLVVMLCLLAILGCSAVLALTASANQTTSTESVATISEAYIPSETPKPVLETEPEEEVIILENIEVERVEPTTLDEANSTLEAAIFRKDTAMAVYEGLLVLGYAEDHPAVAMAKIDVENAEVDVEYYTEQQVILQEAYKWKVRAEEYPVATQAWLYMKNEFGWSDTTCAGIMGNMMAECGGCWSSDLNWNINGSSGYGIIQWIGGRKNQLFSIYGNHPSIEDQLNFVKDELYGTNGVTKQVTDSQLDKIINASSSEDCAYAFATYFERCAEAHRSVRRGYARHAYEYFVG